MRFESNAYGTPLNKIWWLAITGGMMNIKSIFRHLKDPIHHRPNSQRVFPKDPTPHRLHPPECQTLQWLHLLLAPGFHLTGTTLHIYPTTAGHTFKRILPKDPTHQRLHPLDQSMTSPTPGSTSHIDSILKDHTSRWLHPSQAPPLPQNTPTTGPIIQRLLPQKNPSHWLHPSQSTPLKDTTLTGHNYMMPHPS